MKISCCQFCDSPNVSRRRYFGASFVILAILTLGVTLIGIPWLPVTVWCDDCEVEYIAS